MLILTLDMLILIPNFNSTHLISSLGQSYYLIVVYIEVNVLKMSINKAYSMLLTHEATLESVCLMLVRN